MSECNQCNEKDARLNAMRDTVTLSADRNTELEAENKLMNIKLATIEGSLRVVNEGYIRLYDENAEQAATIEMATEVVRQASKGMIATLSNDAESALNRLTAALEAGQ